MENMVLVITVIALLVVFGNVVYAMTGAYKKPMLPDIDPPKKDMIIFPSSSKGKSPIRTPLESLGAVGRLKYFSATLIVALTQSIHIKIIAVKYPEYFGWFTILTAIAYIHLIYRGFQRCNDVKINGFWQFVPLVPLFLLISKGDITGK